MEKICALVVIGLFLTGCAAEKAPSALTVAHSQDEPVDIRITEAARNIEVLLMELGAAQARQAATTTNIQVHEKLEYSVSLTWIGDIETVIKKLSEQVGMRHRVIGRPLAPVLVSLDLKDAPMIDACRIIGMQAGSRADVVYRPSENIIELIYVQ